MKRGYDTIASIYDVLARVFMGKSITASQQFLLKQIPANAGRMLIAGGGTGWVLEEIAALHKQPLQIDYVDISAKMIALAAKRNSGNHKVNFIQSSVEQNLGNQVYDVVMTPFLLDNFSQVNAELVFTNIHNALKPGGYWLYADFEVSGSFIWVKKTVLAIMYAFFRLTCNIEARQLPDVKSSFKKHIYQTIARAGFKGNFITAIIYQKP